MSVFHSNAGAMSRATSTKNNKEALNVLLRLKQKLDGSDGSVSLSVEGHVTHLINVS
jgi:hypothetical protein